MMLNVTPMVTTKKIAIQEELRREFKHLSIKKKKPTKPIKEKNAESWDQKKAIRHEKQVAK